MSKSQYEKALLFSDCHFPWQDHKAIDLTLKIGDRLQPETIFINGDLMDCWEISRWDRSPKYQERGRYATELKQGRDFLKGLRKRFPKARIVYIFGNHEYRHDHFITKNAVQLYGLPGMTLAEQLGLAENNIECIYSGNKESSFLWGKLLIGHFDMVNQHSGYTAKNVLDRKGISAIQAHSHRGGSSFRRLWDRDIVAHESFCLCDRDPCYVDHPNWQLGFLVIHKDRQSDHFFIEPHPITESHGKLKVFFNGACVQV
jgi:predicted MPP superfamily phosphohydrolase